MRRSRRALLATTASVGCCLAATPAASAGTYDVWSCRLPDGRPIEARGWSPWTGDVRGTSNQCDFAGGPYHNLHATLPWEEAGYWEETGWRFRAPVGTEIDNYELYRAVTRWDGREYFLYRDYTDDGRFPPARSVVEKCLRENGCSSLGSFSAGPTAANRVSESNLNGVRALSVVLECNPYDAPTCASRGDHSDGYVEIYKARLGLDDGTPPTFSRTPTGSLLRGSTVSGIQTADFAATDVGGGIKSMGLLVDGELRAEQPVDRAHEGCVPPYVDPVPCRLRVEPTLTFDTTGVPNGTHSVQVVVIDVAGNRRESAPFVVETRNGSEANGRGASQFADLRVWFKSRTSRSARRTVRFRGRSTVEGRLTDAQGSPIAGAILDVATRLKRAGAGWRERGHLVTDDAGSFRYLTARGPSRDVRFAYRAYSLDPAYSALAEAELAVRAAVTLQVRPRRVRNGSRATFSGRVVGGPGKHRVAVAIYAVNAAGRERVPVEVLRTDRRGRFRYRYRFRRIAGRFTYRFQARVRTQPAYPYASASSRRVLVRARP